MALPGVQDSVDVVVGRICDQSTKQQQLTAKAEERFIGDQEVLDGELNQRLRSCERACHVLGCVVAQQLGAEERGHLLEVPCGRQQDSVGQELFAADSEPTLVL